MSARTITCVEITCDVCAAELEFEQDAGPVHWRSRLEAAVQASHLRWEVAVDEALPDLCPACACARDGHRWNDPHAVKPRGSEQRREVQWCGRCADTRLVVDGVPEVRR